MYYIQNIVRGRRDQQGRLLYEEENDDRLSDLHGKVASLKAVRYQMFSFGD